MRMLLSACLLEDRKGLSKQRFRAREITPSPQHVREVVQTDRDLVLCVFPDHLSSDRQRFTKERLSLLVESLALVDGSELDERHGDVLVVPAEEPPPHGQGLFQN